MNSIWSQYCFYLLPSSDRKGAVIGAIGDAAGGVVGGAVGSAVGGAVGGAVVGAVGNAVSGLVGGAAGGAVGGTSKDAALLETIKKDMKSLRGRELLPYVKFSVFEGNIRKFVKQCRDPILDCLQAVISYDNITVS